MNQIEQNRELLLKRLAQTEHFRVHSRRHGNQPFDKGLFNMATFEFGCGSPACISGHAMQIERMQMSIDDPLRDRYSHTAAIQRSTQLADFLGIKEETAELLIGGGFAVTETGLIKNMSDITPDDAIGALEEVFVDEPIEEKSS